MNKPKNIHTILRNVDFDGTVKYYKKRIQMKSAEFEFDIEGHLFSFAEKLYEEILKNISDEFEEEINNKQNYEIQNRN